MTRCTRHRFVGKHDGE